MRPVLLLDIGAGPLPATTPPAVVGASWVPAVYVPPATPVPGAFAATALVDAVLLTWSTIAATSPVYVIERAPDVAGAPGAWSVIARTADLRYTAASAGGTAYWWRVKALVFGRSSAVSTAVQATAKIKNNLFNQEAQPVAQYVNDEWFQPSTKLTRTWNGTGWSLKANLALTQSSGRELLRNATFTSRATGVTYSPGVAGVLVDSWTITDDGGPAPGAGQWWEFPLEPAGIMFRLASGATLVHGVQRLGYIRADRVPVGPGVRLRAILSVDNAWIWNSWPGGISLLIRTYVTCYNGVGAVIAGGEMAFDNWRASGVVTNGGQITTPAGTASVELMMIAYFVNLSGGNVTTGSLPWDARIKAVSLVVMNELEIAGSGARIGDQRNLPQSNTTAYGSVRNTVALSATSAGAVSVNAHTVRYGGASVAYNAVSNAVTGLTVGVTYVIYCFDDAYAGGTRTWFAGTNPDAVMQLGDGVVVAGQITIPTSGTGGGGGGGGGGDPGDWCVDADMVLPDGRRAGDICAGEAIACWDDDPLHPAIVFLQVESNTLVPDQPGLSITTTTGAVVTASDSTPMTLRDGRMVWLPQMLGEDALELRLRWLGKLLLKIEWLDTLNAMLGRAWLRSLVASIGWRGVIALDDAGPRTVAKIKVRQRCYFAGAVATATIATHNPMHKP